MAANINGTNIPTTMAQRGRYAYSAGETLGRNGQGAVVLGEYKSIEWAFPLLSLSDYTWWRSTLLSGNPSLIITSASLYDDLGNLTSFTTGVVLQPTFGTVYNGYYRDVVIKIEDLA